MVEKLLYMAFLHLPDAIVYRLVSAIAFLRSVYRMVTHLAMDVRLYSGRRSGGPVRMLWIGTRELQEYVLDILYDGEYEEEILGSTNLLGLRKTIASLSDRCDLVYVEQSVLLPTWDGFERIPHSLDMRTRLEPSTWTKRRYRRIRNLLQKENVELRLYKISEHLDQFQLFYQELYAPYISLRHGQDQVESLEAMKRFYAKGHLILAYHKEQAIAGNVLLEQGDTLLGCKYGIRDSNNELHRAAASNYSSLKHARENGFTHFDAFHAKPFLRDGLFCNKRSWGLDAHIEKRNYYFDRDLCFRVVNYVFGVTDFMSAHPYIHVRDGELVASLLGRESALVDDVVDQYRDLNTGGIARYEFHVGCPVTDQERHEINERCELPPDSKVIAFVNYGDGSAVWFQESARGRKACQPIS
jgi:hypothetical protein